MCIITSQDFWLCFSVVILVCLGLYADIDSRKAPPWEAQIRRIGLFYLASHSISSFITANLVLCFHDSDLLGKHFCFCVGHDFSEWFVFHYLRKSIKYRGSGVWCDWSVCCAQSIYSAGVLWRQLICSSGQSPQSHFYFPEDETVKCSETSWCFPFIALCTSPVILLHPELN